MKIGPYLVKFGDSVFRFTSVNSLELWMQANAKFFTEQSPVGYGGEYLGNLLDSSHLNAELISGLKRLEELALELESVPLPVKKKLRYRNNRR